MCSEREGGQLGGESYVSSEVELFLSPLQPQGGREQRGESREEERHRKSEERYVRRHLGEEGRRVRRAGMVSRQEKGGPFQVPSCNRRVRKSSPSVSVKMSVCLYTHDGEKY